MALKILLADVFFSTYNTPSGPRLAALLVDGSEILREREEASLQQLLAGSRILVAAVSHEVRNICGAIGVMHENLARQGVLRENQDFDALGSLVETLAKIASVDLKQSTHSNESGAANVDLHDVLTRSANRPRGRLCEESGIQLHWDLPEELPLDQADRHSLLQVLSPILQRIARGLWNRFLKRSFRYRFRFRRTASECGCRTAGREFHQVTNPFNRSRSWSLTRLDWDFTLSRAFMRSFQVAISGTMPRIRALPL